MTPVRRHLSILLVALTPGLAAQQAPDSAVRPDAEQVKALRQQVHQRWQERVRSTLQLSDAQAGQLDETEQRFDAQRQPIRARQRALNQALRAELQASAPDQGRVTQLMSQQQQNRIALQQLDRDQDREMQGYLSPVQRARYQNERRQFQEKVAEIIRHRPPPRPAPSPPRRGPGGARGARKPPRP